MMSNLKLVHNTINTKALFSHLQTFAGAAKISFEQNNMGMCKADLVDAKSTIDELLKVISRHKEGK